MAHSPVKWGSIALVAIAALLLWHMTGSPRYFVCKGVVTDNGTNKPEASGEISAIFDVTPSLNRMLFGSKDYGFLALHNHSEMLRIISINMPNILLADGGKGFGMFDRVSRRLVVNTGQKEYDLICRETKPAAL